MEQGEKVAYRRILLKLSGEALLGKEKFGIDPGEVKRIVEEISQLRDLGVQVAIVIGGGNFCRGRYLTQIGLDRVTADQMGMLATVMNALALRDAFQISKIPARLMSAISMTGLVEPYNRQYATYLLEEGNVLIFASGTGNPLVTTDTAAGLRAIEIKADILLKATKVDGVYSADPEVDKNAKLYQKLSYSEALSKELGVMDLAAFTQCRDHQMPIRVFNVRSEGSLRRIVMGENEGTLVSDSV